MKRLSSILISSVIRISHHTHVHIAFLVEHITYIYIYQFVGNYHLANIIASVLNLKEECREISKEASTKGTRRYSLEVPTSPWIF